VHWLDQASVQARLARTAPRRLRDVQ
jgi:hypothetical protein